MGKNDFKKTIGNVLKEYGFQHIKKSYYAENDEIIIVVALQKSNFSDEYYVNYGFLIKSENPRVQYPKDYQCDVTGRISLLINGKQYHSIIPEGLSEEELSKAMKQYMEKTIKPVIDYGLKKYFEIQPQSIVTANLKAKKYLNL